MGSVLGFCGGAANGSNCPCRSPGVLCLMKTEQWLSRDSGLSL